MSLADVRREYLGQPLSESESDADPFAQFARWFEQVRRTVIHEVGHHFGIDDDRLHELGW